MVQGAEDGFRDWLAGGGSRGLMKRELGRTLWTSVSEHFGSGTKDEASGFGGAAWKGVVACFVTHECGRLTCPAVRFLGSALRRAL